MQIVLGVTWCDPSDITTLPEHPCDLPLSYLMGGYCLYKNGHYVGSCPRLSVSPGDDVSIRHTNKQLIFYLNKQLHYKWDVEIPAPVWGVVGLVSYVNKISIKGKQFIYFHYCDFDLIWCYWNKLKSADFCFILTQ